MSDRGWEIHEWTDEERTRFLDYLRELRARHRANGCEVFDSMTAKCTCPDFD